MRHLPASSIAVALLAVARSDTEAVALLRIACDHGHRRSCDELAGMPGSQPR
jgi:hypothetical protein